MRYESYEIGCVDYCVDIYVHIVLRRKGPVWHGRSAKTVQYIHILGGRDPYARAECEDGAVNHIGRKGPVWHGRSAKTVLYIILGGRDPYGTGGVRRRCYDTHCILTKDWEWMAMCDTYVCVCDTRGMLEVLSYIIVKTSEHRFSWWKWNTVNCVKVYRLNPCIT